MEKSRVKIVSDLHFNFHRDGGLSVFKNIAKGCDALIVAGDISCAPQIEQALTMMATNFKGDIIFTLGNHSYYHGSFDYVDGIVNKICNKFHNLHWLNNSTYIFNGQRFIGATLWFEENANSTNKTNQNFLNDFSCIKYLNNLVFSKYDETKRYLRSNIKKDDIVITHHLPSYQCISKHFENSVLNCFFANNLDDLIIESKPTHWICGHSHDRYEVTIGETKVIRNPLGYPFEANNFQDYIISV